MDFDEKLAARIETILEGKADITKKKMFGGLCFLQYGNMLCGVDNKSQLMLRVGVDQYEKALTSNRYTNAFGEIWLNRLI